MNISFLDSTQAMTGVLFFMAILPFIVIRLGSAMTASSPTPKNIIRPTRSLFVGSALCVMMILSPFMAASAEEVFIIFTESGPEVYQVDTVQEASLTLNQTESTLWPNAPKQLTVDRSMLSNLRVNNHVPVKNYVYVLLPGFQNSSPSALGTQDVGSARQVSQDHGKFEKQMANFPLHITTSILTQPQRMFQQNILGLSSFMPN